MKDYSKNKVLALYRYLTENTDENHQVSMKDIIEYMQSQGYPYSRDTAMRNLNQLKNELGVDIISSRGKYARYYIGARLLEKEELKLIIDSINSSNFIEKEIAKKMLGKLKSIVSTHDAEELDRNVLGVNIAKTENKKILYNVNKLQEALNKGVQIRFRNKNWNVNKELVETKDYWNKINPWTLIWANDRYYLYGYDVNAKLSERHYRVDKMDNIEILDTPRKGEREFRGFDATTYVSRRIGMFSGNETYITVKVGIKLVGAFIDQFGKEITIKECVGEEKAKISFNAVPSKNLLGWLIGLGDVEIISPKFLREDIINLIDKNKNYYSKG